MPTRGALEHPLHCGERFFVRTPALPYDAAGQIAGPLPDADDASSLAGYVQRIARDPVVREAITVSSPQLATAVDRIVDLTARAPDLTHLRRTAFALTRYLLRMTNRATPFGLMAGVAIGRFGSHAAGWMGEHHRAAVRADRGWLAEVVRQLERSPQALRGLHLRANDLLTVRGEQVALFRPTPGSTGTTTTLPFALAVRAAIEAARKPISYVDLCHHLELAFPAESPAAVERLVQVLVAHEFLLTDAWPPLDCPDSLRYLLDRLEQAPDLPFTQALHDIQRDLDQLRGFSPGTVAKRWEGLTRAMARVAPSDNLVQVDLVMDADVRLPHAVAREAQRAAAALWRLSPVELGEPAMRTYHRAFLERYGMETLVPLRELLDPVQGLGDPPGYEFPPREREPGPERTAEEGTQALTDLLLSAVARQEREIVLTDEHLRRLAPGDHNQTRPPASAEIHLQLVAESLEALEAGDYLMVISPKSGAEVAGASIARFAHELDGGPELLRELADGLSATSPDVVHAQLTFRPHPPRLSNIASTPAVLGHGIAVNDSRYATDVSEVNLDDLAVGAAPDRLYLVSTTLGREVVPVSCHMLRTAGAAPNIVRFLDELGNEGVRQLRPWSWGRFADAPFLPRVRYGRAVLSPATWRLPPELLDSPASNWDAWQRAFAAWRTRWSPPSRVLAAVMDNRIPLCLDEAFHLRLLWQECRRRPHLVLQELPGGEERRDGWLRGGRGAFACEIVIPLLRSPAHARPRDAATPVSSSPPRSGRDGEHLPGGEWLTAKLYVPASQQTALVRDHLRARLPGLVSTAGADRWFFIRYRDPEPHLRVRLHGAPGDLWGTGLPCLAEMVRALRNAGLVRHMVIDGYQPELERYGGPAAMATAEAAFQADSDATLQILGLLTQGRSGLELPPVLALSLIDLIRALLGEDESTMWWMELERLPLRDPRSRAWRQPMLELSRQLAAGAAAVELPHGQALAAAWGGRRDAIIRYGELLRSLAEAGQSWTPASRVARNLAHMHVNRMIGIQPQVEQEVFALARSIVAASAALKRPRT